MARKRASFVVSAYADTRVYPSLEAFVSSISSEEIVHAFIIGSPPAFRGSVQEGKNVELQILKAFPNHPPAVRAPRSWRDNRHDDGLTKKRACRTDFC